MPTRPAIGTSLQYVEGDNTETLRAALVVAHDENPDLLALRVFDGAQDNQVHLEKVPHWEGPNGNTGWRSLDEPGV